jgi:hypothetical protein
MKRLLPALLSLLLLPLVAQAQTVTMPKAVSKPVGRMASIEIRYDGTDLQWDVIRLGAAGDDDVDFFREVSDDPKTVRLRILRYSPGNCIVVASTVKDSKQSKLAICLVTFTGPEPPLPPVPPDPKPPVPPVPPPTPAPIPEAGLRVLIVFETATAGAMPQKQQDILYTKAMRDYLNAKCVMGAKNKEWRIYDANIAMDGETKLWQDAMRRPRSAVPWILISNGKTGYEGPLPATVDEAKKLIDQYAPTGAVGPRFDTPEFTDVPQLW